MKKALIVSMVVPMLLGAMPLLASASVILPAPSNNILVSNSNSAVVTNNVITGASTGGNVVSGGGVVMSGQAGAASDVLTSANTNVTTVKSCGCSMRGSSNVTVLNSNHASVVNNVNTGASTGGNVVSGGTTRDRFETTGNGNGVVSGPAASLSDVENYLNSTITTVN